MVMNAGSKVSSLVVAVLALAGPALIDTQALAGTRPAPCELQSPMGPSLPPDSGATNITTVGQAYHCILDNYVDGPNLSSRALLVPAFARVTQELQRRGLDQSRAELPALTGNRFRDWDAFSRTYSIVTEELPTEIQQTLVQATLHAMLASLRDNHAAWQEPQRALPQIGVKLSVFRGMPRTDELDPVALEPVFVTAVAKNSPAEQAGVRAGDEIVAVNDVPLYVNGVLSEGVLEWITHPADATLVTFTLHRPVTNATLAITVAPATMPMQPSALWETRVLDGNIVYARLSAFDINAVNLLLQNISALADSIRLRGIVLDLRENGGGNGEANAKLLSVFAHNIVTGYWCDAKDKCTVTRSDDSMPLLNLPMVTLVGRTCISACDVFANVVKDARLGQLVGTRTGGMVSGPTYAYALNDGSTLLLPKYYQLGARRENIDTIGVAPHIYVPRTAMDLSAGRDPALTKALELLQ